MLSVPVLSPEGGLRVPLLVIQEAWGRLGGAPLITPEGGEGLAKRCSAGPPHPRGVEVRLVACLLGDGFQAAGQVAVAGAVLLGEGGLDGWRRGSCGGLERAGEQQLGQCAVSWASSVVTPGVLRGG